MGEFAILNGRKRALIALVHSIAFLMLAAWQMLAGPPSSGMLAIVPNTTGPWILCAIYLIVSTVLFWLFALSRNWMEKLYFALCTVSATSGLLRTIIGDQGFHSGRFLRVVMLGSAVVVGVMILRIHSALVIRNS